MRITAAALAALVLAGASLPAFAEGPPEPAPSPAAAAVAADTVLVPSGDLISVAIQSDIGSRISTEGDSFAVVTTADYYVAGKLVLPKGSPGYGTITHVKRAGSFHAGGELTFTVKRFIMPGGLELASETNGATSDADKQTEQNGNALGQYLLWGVGVFAKRGNDILIKKGAGFHVATMQARDVPTVGYGTAPAKLDDSLVTHR